MKTELHEDNVVLTCSYKELTEITIAVNTTIEHVMQRRLVCGGQTYNLLPLIEIAKQLRDILKEHLGSEIKGV